MHKVLHCLLEEKQMKVLDQALLLYVVVINSTNFMILYCSLLLHGT
jgi:hypothetical protein